VNAKTPAAVIVAAGVLLLKGVLSMKMYGVDIRALPLHEREAVREDLREYGNMPMDIYGKKSGVVEAVIVGWSDKEPLAAVLHIPPNCPIVEIPPGYIEAYQDNF
jgi:hypothetical protein